VAAVLAPLLVVTVVGAACSSTPASTAPTVVVARGSVQCSTVTGSVDFAPPLTTKGTSAETTTISVTSSDCAVTGSNVNAVKSGVGTATISSPTNSCAGLLTPRPLSVDVTWDPSLVHTSVVMFSGYTVDTNGPGGGGGFTLPDTGGTAKVTGSFAGSDKGAGSTAATYSSMTTNQLLAACGSSTGLASIPVTSGTISLK
jgi:hypothetical protein